MTESGTLAPVDTQPEPQTPPRATPEVRARSGPWQRLAGLPPHHLVAVGVFIGLLLVLLAWNWDAIAHPIHEHGDAAANSILIDRAKSFELFHGNYSRFGFYHPGPAFLSVQAVSEMVLHDLLDVVPTPFNAHLTGVLVLNSLLVALSAGSFARMTRTWAGGVVLAVMAVAYGWILAGSLADTWLPMLYIWPFLLLIVSAASLFTGDGTDLWKFVLAASLLVHGHVAFSMVAVAFSAAVALVWAHRYRRDSIRRIPRHSGIAAAVILVAFVTPIAIEVLRDVPGQLDEYVGYDRPAAESPRDLGAVLRFLFAYWAPAEGGIAFGVTASLGALALAERSQPPAKRHSLLAVLVATGMAWVLAAVYAGFVVDDLREVYTTYFFTAVPIAVTAVLLTEVIETYRRSGSRVVRIGTVALLVVGVLFVASRDGLDNLYPGIPSISAGHEALEAALEPGEPVSFLFEEAEWPLTVGLVEQARRADRPVCAEVGGGLFEPEVEAAFVVVFTEEEVCTPGQVAASRQVFVGRPGLEVPGTPLFADGTMVLTDLTAEAR
jgi:hypothetical protein